MRQVKSVVFLGCWLMLATYPSEARSPDMMGNRHVPSRQQEVRGRVVDDAQQPLSGATVSVKGSETKASTDEWGNFAITLSADTATLVVSYIGFVTQEYPVWADRSGEIVVTMEAEAANELDEIVVVGYGTQRKRDITGAVSSVDAQAIAEVPVTQASQALQGRAAGVLVTNTSNKPGAGATVRIRGNRSFSAGNDPLYVIDGIPITGGLQDIPPQDIASMEVLKDASATAIYGSRGANGVVIITTNRGATGATVVSYDAWFGMSNVYKQIEMMDGPRFAEFKRESRRATGDYDDSDPNADRNTPGLFSPVELESIALGRSTDYQDLMLQTGHSMNHSLSVRGGSEKTRFNISLNYMNDQGIIPIQDFNRYALRLNLDHDIGERIRIGASILGNYSITNGQNLNPYDDTLLENPLGVPFDEDGELVFLPTPDGLRSNPLSELVPGALLNRNKRMRLFSSLYGEVQLAEGLTYRLNFGPDLIQNRVGNFQGRYTNARLGGSTAAQGNEDLVFNYTLENLVRYNRVFNDRHSLEVTGLFGIQHRQFEATNISVRGIPVEEMQYYNFGAAEEILGTGSSFEQWDILSYMGRVNYGYDDRYLVTLTARIDGSSRFGRNHRYGFFPSVAVGWNISNESFMEGAEFFDLLKLRATYGETGNTGIAPYGTQGLLARTTYAFDETGAFGFRPNQLQNDNLKWETTRQLNVGLDFSIFNGRLSGSAEYYRQDTRDLLMQRQLPFTSGFGSVLENIGATRNVGVEFSLSSVNIQAEDERGFNWTTDLNFATNKESILELYGGAQDDVGNRWFIGEPIQVYYDFEKIGIWQANEAEAAASYGRVPGEIKIKDQNGDGVINDLDRVILGNNRPSLTGGFTNRFAYRGFDLSVFLFFNVGNMIYSTFHEANNTLFGRYNNLNVDYWTPDNPTNAYPRPNQNQERPVYSTSMAYFDGSFLKIRNINLGYNFPSSWAARIKAQSLRLYVSAQQPLIVSSYVNRHQGVDPEGIDFNSDSEQLPVDTPPVRTWLLGLNVKF
ncbi:TonB-linked outer membrane protein, SusC/RagA family [Parapedobacter luteus]|uniref:TonB-linked outer membrane protein, SusC/RagA family n=1 Tax=Parapedobacter luteus TaxID=623280 RepID=A0A1T5F655_9SPHI|nr:TonB-dependent receptor [Parapedobacter luteus]SKB91663.1 TonB-linked outer membrane protein, SusC/RagA family [Parapedobacter luteus]